MYVSGWRPPRAPAFVVALIGVRLTYSCARGRASGSSLRAQTSMTTGTSACRSLRPDRSVNVPTLRE